MLAAFAQLNTRKVIVLVMLALIAGRLGWSVISPYLNTAQSDTDQCKALEQNVRDLLSQANHCDTKDDCIQTPLSCPFGCDTYLNAATPLAPIKAKIRAYNKQCGFCVEDCVQAKPACVDHKCVSFAVLTDGSVH